MSHRLAFFKTWLMTETYHTSADSDIIVSKLKLSTRPEKFLGDIETWDRAETKLKEALVRSFYFPIVVIADSEFFDRIRSLQQAAANGSSMKATAHS